MSSPDPCELILAPKGDAELGASERRAGRTPAAERGVRSASEVERERRATRAGPTSLGRARREADSMREWVRKDKLRPPSPFLPGMFLRLANTGNRPNF